MWLAWAPLVVVGVLLVWAVAVWVGLAVWLWVCGVVAR